MNNIIHFENALWKQVFKLAQDDEKQNDFFGLLYHYTTSEGLLGILQNQNIWSTESSFLNDLFEIQYGIDITQDILKIHTTKKDIFVKKFCKLTISYLNIMNSKEEEIYITSFCEKSDLLSQWKGYTNFGEGYAIGLDLQQLTNTKHHKDFKNISIKKVIYDKKTQKNIIKSKIKYMIKESKKLIYQDKKNEENIINACAKSLAYYLNAQSKRFKSNSFSEEKEWRIIYINNTFSKENRVKNKFRITDSIITPYLELNLSNKNSKLLPIKEIIIGPKINYKKASKSINLIYNNIHKNTPKILKSEISLQ